MTLRRHYQRERPPGRSPNMASRRPQMAILAILAKSGQKGAQNHLFGAQGYINSPKWTTFWIGPGQGTRSGPGEGLREAPKGLGRTKKYRLFGG